MKWESALDELAADDSVVGIYELFDLSSGLPDVGGLARRDHRGAVVAAGHEVRSVLRKADIVYRARVPGEREFQKKAFVKKRVPPPASTGKAAVGPASNEFKAEARLYSSGTPEE